MISSHLPTSPLAAHRHQHTYSTFSSAVRIVPRLNALQHAVYLAADLSLPAPQIKHGWTLPSEYNKPDSEGAGERKEEIWEV